MSGKIAFCFPGQGSLEAGMGREIAEAVPEAMEVYDAGSEASGLDLKQLCFDVAARGARRDRGAAAGARRDEPRRARGRPRARDRAGLRRRPLGRRVRGAGRRAGDRHRRRRSGSCASAGSRWPRRRGGTRARWRRSSGSTTRSSRRCAARSSACGRPTTTAPGQIVVSGENDAVDECCAEAESAGARRAMKLKVSGAFHSPLVARAADRLRPAIEAIQLQRADPPVHVDGDRADRVGAASRDAARRPAHRAGEVHAGRDRARPRRRPHLRRGRAGQRPLRARQADRPERARRSR